MNVTLLGIFSHRLNAEKAIEELSKDGFDARDISLVIKDELQTPKVNNHNANIAEGAASGVVTGAVLGGIAGLLIGIGAITLPGISSLLVAGPIASALGLTGAFATTFSGAVTGAVAGGIVGALVGLALPNEDKNYENKMKDNGILIAVPVFAEEEGKAREVLVKNDADMIRSIVGRREYTDYGSIPQQFLDERFYNPEQYPDPVYYSDIPRNSRPETEKVEAQQPQQPNVATDVPVGPAEASNQSMGPTLRERLRRFFS